jgi:predicted nucleic acid-binding protein
MRKVVIDTSIPMATLLNEPDAERLLTLTDGVRLLAAGSIDWEIGNALSKAVKRERISPEKAVELATRYQEIEIERRAVNLDRAVDFAAKYRIYAYDAFVALAAKEADVPLLTLDAGLRRVAEIDGIRVVKL